MSECLPLEVTLTEINGRVIETGKRVDDLHHILTGNGDPEEGLMFRHAVVEKKLTDLLEERKMILKWMRIGVVAVVIVALDPKSLIPLLFKLTGIL